MTPEERDALAARLLGDAAINHVLREVQGMRLELNQHMHEESELLRIAAQLGNEESVKTRIAFIDVLMQREKRKEELFQALLKGTLLAGIIALVTFIGAAVVNHGLDLIHTVKEMRGKP